MRRIENGKEIVHSSTTIVMCFILPGIIIRSMYTVATTIIIKYSASAS